LNWVAWAASLKNACHPTNRLVQVSSTAMAKI
jgi:hypothetical protein